MFKAHLFRIRQYETRDLDAAAQAANAACRLYERHGFVPVIHLIHEPSGNGDVIYRRPGS